MRILICFILVAELTVCGCSKSSQPPILERKDTEPATNRVKGAESSLATNSRNAEMLPGRLNFTDVTTASGIDFVHCSGDSPEKPFPSANGSGVGALDFDLDGQLDLLFLNGTSFPISEETVSPGDRVYRNLKGWTFSEATAACGIGGPGYSAGLAVGDMNSDGFPDVYVNCVDRNRLYMNQGDGTFEESGESAQVDDPQWGTSAVCLDFDADGDLDLYVCNYAEWTLETNSYCGNRQANIRIFCSPRSVKPVSDRLYENLGDGQFRDVLQDAGLNREAGRGQGVIASDIDRDGRIDLYVTNDANPNFYFRNLGGGRFEDLTEVAGTAYDFAGRAQAGMGVDIADADRNGHVEILVTNYENEHNAYYVRQGPNFYEDVSHPQGLAAPSLRWVGWGTLFRDFDLDGWTDLVVSNGHTDSNLHEMERDAEYLQPPLLFRNEVGRLQLVSQAAGSYFDSRHPGRALCCGDLDRDGDPDLVFGHRDAAPGILRNDSVRSERRTITLRFIGVLSNRDGAGAVVEAATVSPTLIEELKSGGSYLSAQPCEVIMSLPRNEEIPLDVRWPSGTQDRIIAPENSGSYGMVEGRGIFRIEDDSHEE